MAEPTTPLHLTYDEAQLLYKAYVNGIHGGNRQMIDRLAMKVERAKHAAEEMMRSRAARATGQANG